MSEVIRYRDWQSRLAQYLAGREAMPFEWGSNDCAMFVCSAIEAISGFDPGHAVRGYGNEREAARIVKSLGGMPGVGHHLFGQEIHPMQAQVGDVGLIEIDGRESFALCGGSLWLGPGLEGITRVPINVALAAWRCF